MSWSNSLIEAQWRKIKHDWLFINRLDTLATVERLVAFYIDQYNTVIPQYVLRGRTPDEVFNDLAVDLPDRLREAHQVAIKDRIEANRRLSCDDCVVAKLAKLAKDSEAEPRHVTRKDE